ncbi:hypothetical protein GLOIN_2v1788457 [Rhizophagus irregularis DAOM 181602=DAOM 197198]|uniref:Uncharacterized protein n=1 Tax=Rhizophagus irregularis (strain DAOM 181602 / DAOM 197198 / MUCL 43194) TaxID=747089 RepID=A0A2P4P3L9_RHIID|nr:hypothetical protein GLOIN_2v1788457 [Rhizophagus irregularis DAOM 181602=DAOM 197198]POG59974.1 hypothetical protein GLOIN_2v1788457 [Rhizophagus irregularis DAOM 181602=DAOM 197198]|eukprot:XP_025166840.1 hypothetical protein GLOIN_2v1788457 [Rhizophagus irregularis DAOM 181602=DAOM 197198]
MNVNLFPVYWDIIPPDPIYADDGTIGTTKFSILDLRTEDERRKKAQIAKRERLDREQHLEIEAAKQADIVQKKEKAALIGTSWKHVESRSRMMFKYIRLNDMFHAAMTRIREKQLQNLASGGTNHYTKTAREDDPYASPFTSEDTKVLEFQPNKRDVDRNIVHNATACITDMGLCKSANYNELENTKKCIYESLQIDIYQLNTKGDEDKGKNGNVSIMMD